MTTWVMNRRPTTCKLKLHGGAPGFEPFLMLLLLLLVLHPVPAHPYKTHELAQLAESWLRKWGVPQGLYNTSWDSALQESCGDVTSGFGNCGP